MKYTSRTNNESHNMWSKEKLFSLFLGVSLILVGCNFKNKEKDSKNTNRITINHKESELSLQFHKDGNLKEMDTVKEEEKSGVSWEYYPNGNIKGKYHYQNGITVNSALEYHSSGSLRAYKFFDTKGRLAYLRNYAEDGSFDSESGVLITYNEDEIMLENDTLTLSIQMPEPPGTKISSVIIFEDSSLNPIDSIKFEASNFEVKIPAKEISNLLIKAQLSEREVFTCNDKRINISDLVDLCSPF
jgi:hypothetical protein